MIIAVAGKPGLPGNKKRVLLDVAVRPGYVAAAPGIGRRELALIAGIKADDIIAHKCGDAEPIGTIAENSSLACRVNKDVVIELNAGSRTVYKDLRDCTRRLVQYAIVGNCIVDD